MAPETMQDPSADSSSDEDLNDPAVNGWEDLEDDTIRESFVSLFDDKKFEDLSVMFKYCKDKYDFDIWYLQQHHQLDFIGLVKLINYVRASVRHGEKSPDLSSRSLFDDNSYLMPVLESDAVLYNLEDILLQSRTSAQSQVEELQDQLNALQVRFDAYQHDVSKYLGDKLTDLPPDATPGSDPKAPTSTHRTSSDQGYFESYSFNSIHETMLKDKVRTDAYRDFIYDNKSIFQGKTVLDVGCGTGILSMFCAKAGAKSVIAVDNSDIVSAAREIIKANKLDDKILCLKGKIEEVQLPVNNVDIIVSEWMGYCLLYESMLDSVIYARDKYLAPGGLMVPSHATLEVGILADSDVRETHIDFWNDVYGFDMRSMVARTREECLIKSIESTDISGKGTTFRAFDLHTTTVQDLDFEADFTTESRPESVKLDGFVIWFDIFFQPSPQKPAAALDKESTRERGSISFSTGPFSSQTHWQQGICFTEPSGETIAGKQVKGKIRFRKAMNDARGLKVDIDWQVGSASAQTQSWLIS